MKKFILVACFVSFIAAVSAQDALPRGIKKTLRLQLSNRKVYIEMTGGQLKLVRNDTASAFTAPMVLTNGISVRPNGTYLVDGKEQTLGEGDRIYLTGKIVKKQKA